MERFKLMRGELCAPPVCDVSVEGRAMTNFRRCVETDASFAEANGYFPIAAEQEPEPPTREGYETLIRWRLEEGCWQCSYEHVPVEIEQLLPED